MITRSRRGAIGSCCAGAARCAGTSRSIVININAVFRSKKLEKPEKMVNLAYLVSVASGPVRERRDFFLFLPRLSLERFRSFPTFVLKTSRGETAGSVSQGCAL
jgi:hypothetical protein